MGFSGVLGWCCYWIFQIIGKIMDMNKCKSGDKLLLRNGEVAIYINKSYRTLTYPHDIVRNNSNGVISCVNDDGYFYSINTPNAFDVIGFKSNDESESERLLIFAEVMDQINTDVSNSRIYRVEDIVKNCPIEILKTYLKRK
jgi:hypothetical protein